MAESRKSSYLSKELAFFNAHPHFLGYVRFPGCNYGSLEGCQTLGQWFINKSEPRCHCAMLVIFLPFLWCIWVCLKIWRHFSNISLKNADWKTSRAFPFKTVPFQVTFVHFRGVMDFFSSCFVPVARFSPAPCFVCERCGLLARWHANEQGRQCHQPSCLLA